MLEPVLAPPEPVWTESDEVGNGRVREIRGGWRTDLGKSVDRAAIPGWDACADRVGRVSVGQRCFPRGEPQCTQSHKSKRTIHERVLSVDYTDAQEEAVRRKAIRGSRQQAAGSRYSRCGRHSCRPHAKPSDRAKPVSHSPSRPNTPISSTRPSPPSPSPPSREGPPAPPLGVGRPRPPLGPGTCALGRSWRDARVDRLGYCRLRSTAGGGRRVWSGRWSRAGGGSM
jgi:hypothetical protein